MYDPYVDPPVPVLFGYCKYCGGEIYEYDEIAEIDGDLYHFDCFTDCAASILVEQYGAVIKEAEIERGIAIYDNYKRN